ncbi:MAG: hypothetical protein H6815_01455 [Phycisphaeraceae bacterium]|nr:hypothetical protein [Phycisphaerales bacterium]MCB9859093.1 hypothetical protein [Phycisphaeraceae bacterium]
MSRKTHLTIASIALVICAVSVWQMVLKVRTFQKTAPREVFSVQRVDLRQFGFAGRDVRIDDITMPGGEDGIAVHYGDESFELRASMTPGHPDLPKLERHKNWLAVVRFAPALGIDLADLDNEIEAGNITDRLAIVTRTQRLGSDEETWGEIDRKAWKFDFYEFLPEGGFDHTSGHLASSRKAADPERGEIDRFSWQYPAAYQIMPNISFVPSVGGRPPAELPEIVHALSWTSPTAFVSCLIAVLSLALGLGPSRIRQPSNQTVQSV